MPVQVTRTRLQLSQKLWRERGDEAEPASGLPERRNSGPGRLWRRPKASGSSPARGRRLSSVNGMNWSARSCSIAPSGITSMKVKSKPRPCAQSTRASASSSLKPLRATALILTSSPASTAASMPCHDGGVIAPSGHRPELVGVERVERDINPPDAAIGEFVRETREQRAVGGQRDLVERPAFDVARRPRNSDMTLRRTSGSPPVTRSLRAPRPDEGRAKPVELLEREDVALGEEVHVLGHAIDAAKVAAVRHRDAHIGDASAKRVDERRVGNGGEGVHRRER